MADFLTIRAALAEVDEDIVFADGFESALVGYADHWTALPGGGATRAVSAVYDRAKCIAVFVERDGMTEEEAEECFDFNVAGAYVGAATPIFATFVKDEE